MIMGVIALHTMWETEKEMFLLLFKKKPEEKLRILKQIRQNATEVIGR